jgi:MerR family transcriptional regulator/heat shock protein HspR
MEHSSQMAVVHLHIVTPAKEGPYSLEELAQLADVPPALAQHYFDEGLLEPVAGHARTAWFFDDNALYELRLIQRLRRELGVNISGVAVIRQLQRQIDELKKEIEQLREGK